MDLEYWSPQACEARKARALRDTRRGVKYAEQDRAREAELLALARAPETSHVARAAAWQEYYHLLDKRKARERRLRKAREARARLAAIRRMTPEAKLARKVRKDRARRRVLRENRARGGPTG